MSHALRKLQDEAAKLATELDTLRTVSPADDAEAATIEGNIAAAVTRSEEITAEIARQNQLEARRVAAVENLRSAVAPTDSRADVERAVEARKAPAIHVMPGNKNVRSFGSAEAAAKAGRFLQALARGELRSMGETSPTYDAKGSELVSAELYAGFIDVLGYASVGLQVASGFQTSSNSIVVPRIGEIEAEWFDELGDMSSGDEMTTDKVEILLHKMGRTIEISNELVQDSAAVVNLAATVANRFGLAIGKKLDAVWLQGDEGKSIDGLVDLVSEGNSVTQGEANDGADLAELVGKIDSRASNTAWVVSSAGWAHIMKASVVNQSTAIGDRVLPVVMGAPVYRCLGLPSSTLALYGDFSMATAVAYKANGLQVAASEHAGFTKDSVVFRGTQRVGIANHDASFVAKLVVAD